MLTIRTWRPVMLKAVASVAGALLYALSIYLTAILSIPGSDNVQLRPGIVIPVVCGTLFGPLAGFICGALGNLLADRILGWDFWPYWYIGNGVIGLAVGLFRPSGGNYARLSTVFSVTWRACAGIVAGMALASISERWVTQSSWEDILHVNFLPAALSNLANAIILVPIVLLLYGILREATRFEPLYNDGPDD